jgi:hypothetical protein
MKSLPLILLSFIYLSASAQEQPGTTGRLYLHTDVLKYAVGDFEGGLEVTLSDNISVGVSGGYDRNFLNDGATASSAFDRTETRSDEDGDIRRYFWGSGPVGRACINWKERKLFRLTFSFELNFKKRNYSGLRFKEDYNSFREDGNQSILGGAFKVGTDLGKGRVVLSPFVGIGNQVLLSHITRDAFQYSYYNNPERRFHKTLMVPSINFGLLVKLKVL